MSIRPLNTAIRFVESFVTIDYVIIGALIGAIIILLGGFK